MELEPGDWTGWLGKTNISDPRVFSPLYSIREELFWPTYLISMCHFFMNISDLIRNHVHFSAGEPGEDGVISGMRKSAGLNIPPKCHTWIKRIGTISRVRNHIFDIRLRNNSLVEEKLNMELFEFVDVNIKHLHPEAEPQLMTLWAGWA